MSLESFIQNIQASKRFSSGEIELIKKAGEFAESAHSGQKRKSCEPYFNHCLATANILFSWNLDAKTVIAGFLHDSIEDTGVSVKDIVSQFGKDIGFLV